MSWVWEDKIIFVWFNQMSESLKAEEPLLIYNLMICGVVFSQLDLMLSRNWKGMRESYQTAQFGALHQALPEMARGTSDLLFTGKKSHTFSPTSIKSIVRKENLFP